MRAIIGGMAILLGVQAQAQPPASEARPPQPLEPLLSYFSMDDYPETAVQRHAQGNVLFTLIVDRRGVPSRCIVDQSANDPYLDRGTCAIMMTRVRFAPARNARGRTVEGRYSNRVRWVLPDRITLPAGTVPLTPLRVMTVSGVRAGEIYCRAEIDGQDVPSPAGDRCSAMQESGTAARLRRIGRDVELTNIIALELDDRGSPFDRVDRGELISELAARLTISPDGRTAECRPTIRRIIRRIPGLNDDGNACAIPLANGSMRFYLGASAPAEPKFATVRIRLYLREAGAAPVR